MFSSIQTEDDEAVFLKIGRFGETLSVTLLKKLFGHEMDVIWVNADQERFAPFDIVLKPKGAGRIKPNAKKRAVDQADGEEPTGATATVEE